VKQVLPLGRWLSLPGMHNFQNALAATCTALLLETTPSQIEAGLTRFEGLPHRLQFVAENSRTQILQRLEGHDTRGALLAVDAFRSPVVLLAGGYDKGLDLIELARGLVAGAWKSVALLGQTAEKLKTLMKEADPEGRVPTKVHVTMEAAFQWAAAQSAPGDVVLLSPGCASYDWFPNYEARGEEFTCLAREWK